MYLCCQLLEKHKDFCGFKKKKREKKSVRACVWQGREAAHTRVYLGIWFRGEGKSRRSQAGAARVQRDVEDAASCLELPFVPLHVLSYLKVAIKLKINPNMQLKQLGALGRTSSFLLLALFSQFEDKEYNKLKTRLVCQCGIQ